MQEAIIGLDGLSLKEQAIFLSILSNIDPDSLLNEKTVGISSRITSVVDCSNFSEILKTTINHETTLRHAKNIAEYVKGSLTYLENKEGGLSILEQGLIEDLHIVQECNNIDLEEIIILVADGSMLHDIGKALISEDILNGKNSELTQQEWNKIRNHPVLGSIVWNAIQKHCPYISEKFDSIKCLVIEMILGHHHTYPNGGGYGKEPSGFIHIVQLLSFFDAFDSMLSVDRLYNGNDQLSEDEMQDKYDEILLELVASSGSQFNSEVVKFALEYLTNTIPENFSSVSTSITTNKRLPRNIKCEKKYLQALDLIMIQFPSLFEAIKIWSIIGNEGPEIKQQRVKGDPAKNFLKQLIIVYSNKTYNA